MFDIVQDVRRAGQEDEQQLDDVKNDADEEVGEESEEGGASAPEESTENAEGEDEEDEAPASLATEKARIIKAWNGASAGARAEFVTEYWDQISIVHEQLDAIAQESRWDQARTKLTKH
jgi:hypothetical protein